MRVAVSRMAPVTLLALSLTACGGGGSGSSPDNGSSPVACADRVALCADLLQGAIAGPFVNNAFFAPPQGAAPPFHDFEGTLGVTVSNMLISPGETSGRIQFPELSVQFMLVGEILLPLEREFISGGGANTWDIILSPGRAWSEPGDQGMSRASFPFTLVTNQWNEAHNGVATLLFDDSSVSNLHFQVSQETAVWNKPNMRGAAQASYVPGVVANSAQVEQDFLDELDERVTVRAWSDLTVDYPGIDLSIFTRNIAQSDISASGILVDNDLYFRGASTRFGDYPYPLEMRHGVFSVTKSSQAALTLLRLAEKYGGQVFDLFVSDYVTVSTAHAGWNGVTFGDVLSMTTGIGNNSPDPNAQVTFADENDESSPIWRATWNTYPKDDKLREAFRYGDYPWAPGQIVRYNTAHTFILGAAMQGFYETMEGPGVSVWQMMKDEVYSPIGIKALPTIQTVDANPIPIYGFGLFMNAYDTARISQVLTNDGSYNGNQILHRERTRQSMYKTAVTGFDTYVSVPMAAGNQAARYLHSFWSFALTGPGNCFTRVPYMWGFGGNFVTILPNGVSAFRFADGDVHDPAALALATEGIRPFC